MIYRLLPNTIDQQQIHLNGSLGLVPISAQTSKSHKVLTICDWLQNAYHFKIWQVDQQHCCWATCQILEGLKNFVNQSHNFLSLTTFSRFYDEMSWVILKQSPCYTGGLVDGGGQWQPVMRRKGHEVSFHIIIPLGREAVNQFDLPRSGLMIWSSSCVDTYVGQGLANVDENWLKLKSWLDACPYL